MGDKPAPAPPPVEPLISKTPARLIKLLLIKMQLYMYMHILTLFLLLALRIRIRQFLRKTETRPNQKLEDSVRYRIEEVGPDGEPLAPDDVKKFFVKACGTLVRDNI